MKKQSLFYNIICVLALTACSSSTRYVISGTVPEDLNGKYIYICCGMGISAMENVILT